MGTCIVGETMCERCEAMRVALDDACRRNVALEQQVATLEAQLAETMKLCELQQADIERYRKAYEASRPNHPERAPRDQLQLAFARVLEALGETAPANDGDSEGGNAEADSDKEEEGNKTSGTGRGRKSKRGKPRPHGRRKLDLSNLAVIEDERVPDEVKVAGGEGFRLIGKEVSERVAWRPGDYVCYRLVRLKFAAIDAIVASGTVTAVENVAGVVVQDSSGAAEQEGIGAAEQDDAVAQSTTHPSDAAVVARSECSGAATDGGDADAHTSDVSALSSDPSCGGTRIVIAPLPAGLWPNCMGDASAIAHVMVSKYGDLLPLNRQQTIAARGGFLLPKSTQCSWLGAAHGFCAPVVDAMMDDAKKGAFVIATDATGARVLPERRPAAERDTAPDRQTLVPVERRRCESWHVFVFIADRDHVVFRYDRKNNGEVMARMLDGYHGNLLADASSVFDVLYNEHDMTEHGCWFHARRPFYRALETDPPRALEALSIIGKLFEVDRELRAEELDLASFTRQRRERAGPVLDLFDKWIESNRDRVDPRSPLASGIGYYDNQRVALRRFLGDGRIPIHNNESEQALRNLVVGLANWIFFANETGIAWYTTFRSLIASCVLHRLDPAIYLEQLLRIVPHWPKKRVIELAPKYWIDTVGKLDDSWRAMLARPWEPGVIPSARIAAPVSSSSAAAERAA